jgi:cyclopropane-fatty-acyl-phospholipid synthase
MSPSPRHHDFIAKRIARAVIQTGVFGLSYATTSYFMSEPNPLDPAFVWNSFTKRRSKFVQALIDGYPFPFQRKVLMRRALSQSHAKGIEYHYDISNEFFKLFLDRDFMFYSCADFAHDDDTIETAQRRKADYLLRLIAPQAGERIFEFGCGWGSMLRHIHSVTGDKNSLSGSTLSKEQARFVRDNFGFNVRLEDFIEADYAAESYDKIYSIGAMEHVRPDEILPLLRKLHTALTPCGRLVQHFFSLNTGPLPTSMVAVQIMFPGSTLATHAHHLNAAREAGFNVIHDSSHDYRPTLKAWFARLVENRKQALELVGVETYNRYLVFFANSWAFFDQKQATLHRLVLEKN